MTQLLNNYFGRSAHDLSARQDKQWEFITTATQRGLPYSLCFSWQELGFPPCFLSLPRNPPSGNTDPATARGDGFLPGDGDTPGRASRVDFHWGWCGRGVHLSWHMPAELLAHELSVPVLRERIQLPAEPRMGTFMVITGVHSPWGTGVLLMGSASQHRSLRPSIPMHVPRRNGFPLDEGRQAMPSSHSPGPQAGCCQPLASPAGESCPKPLTKPPLSAPGLSCLYNRSQAALPFISLILNCIKKAEIRGKTSIKEGTKASAHVGFSNPALLWFCSPLV